MIPDRAPEQKRQCLTMFCYQQMPMVPQTPSNREQRRLVAETPHQSPDQAMPKKIGRPKGPVKLKVKAKDPRAQAKATLSANHAKRIKREVMELFKHGPLTVNMVQRATKQAVRQAAGRKVMDWHKRGLIVEVPAPKRLRNGNEERAKWWGLKK